MDVVEDKKRSQWLDDLTWEQQVDPDWNISENMLYMSKCRRTAIATAPNKVPYIYDRCVEWRAIERSDDGQRRGVRERLHQQRGRQFLIRSIPP